MINKGSHPVNHGFNLSDIPSGVNDKGLAFHADNSIFGYISQPLIEDLASLLRGKRVLEAYAGRGHLSAALLGKGIQIKTTSIQFGHDCSRELGHVVPVEIIDVVGAVKKYADWMDVLLVCWPTTDSGMERCLDYLPADAIIVFIGEVTDYQASPVFLGGCATDEFFGKVVEIKDLSESIRFPTPRQDKVKVFRKR